MAATFAGIPDNSGLVTGKVPGHLYELECTMTGDSSYPTGGYAFGITQLQSMLGGAGSLIDSIDVEAVALVGASSGTKATTAYLASYDYQNSTFQLFWPGATAADNPFAEVTSTTNVSTAVIRFRVRYR